MKIRKFINEIEKILPCRVICCPKDKQILIFINVNNRDCKFCYDEEFIERNGLNTILAVIEDDLFRVGAEVNISGRV